MPTKTVTPVEALRIVTENSRRPSPSQMAVSGARGCFLAAPVEVDALPSRLQSSASAIAGTNGYGLGESCPGGRYRFRSRSIEAEEQRRPAGTREAPVDDGLPLLERLETGDLLPPGVDRILPVAGATVAGDGVIDVSAAAVPGEGAGVIPPGGGLTIPPGTPITARLQALLLARGASTVTAVPPWEVGTGTIGSELLDPGASPDDELTGDINGFWMPGVVETLGLQSRPLGIAADRPESILELLRRAERCGLGTVVLSGGLGDGITDRTIEALRMSPWHIFFETLALAPATRLVFAQGLGIDLFVLGGAPLHAALGFDLAVAPALLAARGSPPPRRDWSCTGSVARIDDASTPVSGADNSWTARAVVAGAVIPLTRSRDAFLPGLPGQTGWELLSPASAPPRRCYRIACTES